VNRRISLVLPGWIRKTACSERNERDHSMNYEAAVKQLQETGSMSLMDFKEMSYEDLEDLLEEIKKWALYANGNAEKLEKKKKKKKKKK
jgi:predicted house-cleaning noncanonical NTP pyrophosphatase (MazG superfamily)